MSMKKFNSKQEKIEYVIENWDKKSIAELSLETETAPMTIAQWATRCRKAGINLKRRNGFGIDWVTLQKKYANKS